MGAGSCAFDLASRLGLLPGQPNADLGEFEKLPLDQILRRDDRYCARISRHGLVMLISKHLQEITLRDGNIVVLTDIGRFKIYEHDHHTYVHFDGANRSHVIPLVEDQVLDDLIRGARGEYKMENLGITVEDLDTVGFHWIKPSLTMLSVHAVAEVFAIPGALTYVSGEIAQRWDLFKKFSQTLLDAVLTVMDEVEEPANMARALERYRQPRGTPLVPVSTSVEEGLAFIVLLLHGSSRKNLEGVPRQCKWPSIACGIYYR